MVLQIYIAILPWFSLRNRRILVKWNAVKIFWSKTSLNSLHQGRICILVESWNWLQGWMLPWSHLLAVNSCVTSTPSAYLSSLSKQLLLEQEAWLWVVLFAFPVLGSCQKCFLSVLCQHHPHGLTLVKYRIIDYAWKLKGTGYRV